MVVLINKNIQKGVAFLTSSSSEIVWLKLSKTHFRFKNDVYLCFVYIAPANSSYVLSNNLDILHRLESDIIKYSKLGSIVVMGDTNARTGTEYYCIDNNNRHIPIPFDMCKTSFIRKGKSQDLTVCPRDKDLLELCIEANLSILNGKNLW